jgi:hypothetical protein
MVTVLDERLTLPELLANRTLESAFSTRALVVDGAAARVPEALPRTVQSQSTARSIVDAPTDHDYSGSSFEMETDRKLSGKYLGNLTGVPVATRADGTKITVDSQYYYADPEGRSHITYESAGQEADQNPTQTLVPEYEAPIMADTPGEAGIYANREEAHGVFREYARRLDGIDEPSTPLKSMLDPEHQWKIAPKGRMAKLGEAPVDAPTGSGRFQYTTGVPAAGLREFMTHLRDRVVRHR